MDVASLVSEIWLLFVSLQKQPKFPFRPWTIVYGGQKIELALKFMQVEVDVKCMQTNFGGHGGQIQSAQKIYANSVRSP